MNSHLNARIGHLFIALLLVGGAVRSSHSATPSIEIKRSDGRVQIHFRGGLESAAKAEGPYQRIAGAVSPWTPGPESTNYFWRASLPGMSTIAAGFWHTAAVRADGSLWTWGTNSHGQLGNPAVLSTPLPQRVGAGNSWVAVAASATYTLALQADGTLWAWGNNELGQIGQGTFGGRFNVPTQIGTGTNWQSFSVGSYHVIALQEDGSMWIWGGNPSGQLGNGSYASTNTPQRVQPEHRWLSVAAGHNHTTAVRGDGTLWTCGENRFGQIGDGVRIGPGFPYPPADVRLTLVQIGTATDWTTVTAEGNRSMAIRADGSLWAWGQNYAGQCGNGSQGDIWQPQQVTDAPWTLVTPGESHTVALRDGTLWRWGNPFGLGTNVTTLPQLVDTNSVWSELAAGAQYSIGLRKDGTLWSWGFNSMGQLGNGSFTNCPQPVELPGGAVWGRADE